MTTFRLIRRCVLVAAAAALSSGAFGVPTAGGAGARVSPTVPPPPPAGCAAPYPATFAAVTYPVAEPVVLPWAGGTALDRPAVAFDTDGDGTADTITDLPDGAFRVVRASGSLELPPNTMFANRDDAMDVDGDGASDLVVVADPAGATPGTYLVPGSTPDGQVDLASEAVRLPDHLANARAIGHQDEDGADDVAANTAIDGRGSTGVYSGADLAAPGPGGTADPDPLATFPGPVLGLAAFDPDRPTLITASGRPDGGGATIVVQGDPVTSLTLAGSRVALAGIDPETTEAAAVADGEAVWVVLSHLDRSGSQVWGWNLSDLCDAPAVTGAEPMPAPGATPVAGAATYTG